MRGLLTPLGLFLLLLAIGLSVTLYTQFNRPAEPVQAAIESELAPEPVLDQAATENFRLPALLQFTEIVDRPLFLESRRPPPKVKHEAPQQVIPEQEQLEYVLTGVMTTGERPLAFFKPTAQGKTQRLKQGESLDGWLVKAIEERRVILARGSLSQVLTLQKLTSHRPRAAVPVSPGARRPAKPPAQARRARKDSTQSGSATSKRRAQAKRRTEARRQARARRQAGRRRRAGTSAASGRSSSNDPRSPGGAQRFSSGSSSASKATQTGGDTGSSTGPVR